MRILVVEDENGISQFIKQGLQEAGYSVDVACDGCDGLEYALAADYDALVLDILLPRMSGLELLQELRSRRYRVPVILLTARDAVDDRVRGLDAGADDYLAKPFAFSELLARLRAVLRRPALSGEAILRLGDLELDTLRREARREGKRIELSPREFGLLEYLMRHRGLVLTRTQIVEHVWNFDYQGDSKVVDVYIGYLRQKIDREFHTPLILTVRGAGYRMSDETDESV